MNIGRLNKRISIERNVPARTPSGAVVSTWEPLVRLWAERMDRSGLQKFVASQDLNIVTTAFRIRYRTDIDATMRVVYAGRFYNIQAVLDIKGTNQFLELMCIEGSNDG